MKNNRMKPATRCTLLVLLLATQVLTLRLAASDVASDLAVLTRDRQKAFDKLARDYEQIRPDVQVIVQTIPERAYKQWATTQCLGGTAPDLMQAEGIFDQQWALLATRYMVPLTPYVNEINPHNEGT